MSPRVGRWPRTHCSGGVEALTLAHTPPGWPPGERAHYSNVGYAVLGLVLKQVAGCSYAGALQRHVVGPCAMTGNGIVGAIGIGIAVWTFVPSPDVPPRRTVSVTSLVSRISSDSP